MSETIYMVITGEYGPGDHTPEGFFKSFHSAEKAALEYVGRYQAPWPLIRSSSSVIAGGSTLAQWSNQCDYVEVRCCSLED